MVVGTLDQQEIAWKLYLIELLGLLIGLRLLKLEHLVYPRLLTRFGMLIFTDLNLPQFHVRYLALFPLSNRRRRVVMDGKSSQEYPINTGVPQGSIFCPTFFLLYFNGLPDDVICDIAIYADDTISILSLTRHWSVAATRDGFWAWIWSTRHWTGTGSGLLISMLKKFVSFDQSNNTSAIDVKMVGSFLEGKSSFKMLRYFFVLNWIGALTLSLLLKLPTRKLELWFVQRSFFFVRLLGIFINLPYCLTCNTVIMSGLMLLAAVVLGNGR